MSSKDGVLAFLEMSSLGSLWLIGGNSTGSSALKNMKKQSAHSQVFQRLGLRLSADEMASASVGCDELNVNRGDRAGFATRGFNTIGFLSLSCMGNSNTRNSLVEKG